MVTQHIERRFCAILAADVVGYSRLMGEDEETTLGALRSSRDAIHRHARANGGRVFGVAGDSLMAEFASPVDAVRCAIAIQKALDGGGAPNPAPSRMRYRIGINLGDVLVEGDSLFGDGVNIAARVEELAGAGEICMSEEVYRHVRKKVDLDFDDLGEHTVKNIREPIRVYRVLQRTAAADPVPAGKGAGNPAGIRAPGYAQPGVSAVPARKPAIAVLPFDNLTRDAEQEYFCDGLTSDITTDLSRFANLFVIAAHSAFTYKGRAVMAQDVGRDLGVRYLLEGSVQRVGERIRITAQLIDTHSGHHLWAERFDRNLEEFFEIQDEIVQMIVAGLAVKVEAAERERVARKDPVNMNAYELYMKGVHVYSHETREKLERSRKLFERAAELEPDFSRAWGYLAYTYVRSYMCGWMGPEGIELATEFAKKAVELDPYDYANWWDMAFVHFVAGRFRQALAEYGRASVLNPNDADLLAEMAETLVFNGQAEDAIREIQRAMRINPRFPDWYRWNLGWAYYNAREYEKTIEELENLIDPPAHALMIIAAAQWRLGREDAARASIAAALEREPDYTITRLRTRGVFRSPEDERHWLEAVSSAGLPQ